MRAGLRIGALFAGALLAAVLAGCGAHTAGGVAPASPGASATPIVVLPLENLASRVEYGDRVSRIVWSTVASSGRFDAVEPGEVEAAMNDVRVRSTGMLTRDQILKLSGRLKARWIMAGTLLECGTVRTPDGEVPSIALSLRILDGQTGRVAWTNMRARTGEDRETIFGWGRVSSLERLTDVTVRELIAGIRIPAGADSLAGHGDTK
ncbi:MAG: hypothetical protein HZA61_06300 [Candidatus Eisenbacteria bacterium]|uniref:Penicillin-binding protein activator LpoB n=1 Tax=Eiseniibacteriota bacterium TaxID=2212470 RepID=A0A933WA86_UNCEI|nr:hypothetical protein [Candidatus Eisenbacteria bacterium]